MKGGIIVKEIAGGFWLGALGAGAVLGLIPGIILFILGAMCAVGELVKEQQEEKQAASWRKNYPSYKY